MSEEFKTTSDSAALSAPEITFLESPEYISTPIVAVRFSVSVSDRDSLKSVSCQLVEQAEEAAPQDCISGSISYSDLVDGNYSLRVLALTTRGARSEEVLVFRKDTTARRT